MYLIVCLLVAIAGSMLIGFGSNHVQGWYLDKYEEKFLSETTDY